MAGNATSNLLDKTGSSLNKYVSGKELVPTSINKGIAMLDIDIINIEKDNI
jgi:hypothetical protein